MEQNKVRDWEVWQPDEEMLLSNAMKAKKKTAAAFVLTVKGRAPQWELWISE